MAVARFMKPLLAAFLLFSASGLFGGDIRSVMGTLPARSGIPVAYVDGQRLVIVGYKGTNPVVLKDGSKLTVHDARVSIIPGEAFAPGVVTIDQAEATSQTNWQRINGEYAEQRYNIFYAKLTADRELSDVYLILLEFEDLNGDYSGAPKVAILGTAVGHMEAGVKKTVSADFPPLLSKRQLHWVALVFSGGVQVHSGSGEGLLDNLFDMVDHVGLQKVIEERRYGSHPLMVYRRFPFKFDDEMKTKYHGQTVRLNVSITAEGTLDYVQSDSGSDDLLTREVARQMATWLFIPKIENGGPLESSVVLPIKF
jgi:hypothetical protein